MVISKEKTRILVTMNKTTVIELKELAEIEDRTVSYLVNSIVRQHLDEKKNQSNKD